MALRYDTISFLSDYGRTDEFVGVVHSVIRQLAPQVRVIDITHDIPQCDVRAGGLTLGRSAQYLAPGVVVAVVDPGVGTHRRAVAIEVDGGQSVLVGPDNGILAAAVAVAGGATRAVHLTNPDYQLATAGSLFDGRDVFAPAAAHLCNGVPILELGEEISTSSLLPGTLPIPERTDDGMIVQVLWIDHFGNVQLNADPGEVAEMGDVFEVRTDARSRTVRRHDAFEEVGLGVVGLVLDSYGALSLVCNQASAAEELGLNDGDSLTLVPLDPDSQEVSSPTQTTSGTNTAPETPSEGTPVRLSTAPQKR
ncbi:MAG: SAM-dependent chlorinase/fluorinase [Microthrixaceae bacterium]|nr:SAM-dependent chlorinase/fluorinase [Microthrixaceae bacterium]